MSVGIPDNAARRRELYGLLGDLPARERPIAAETVWSEARGAYHLEKLVLDLNGVEAVPAYFIRPLNGVAPMPAVLYQHTHSNDYGRGKEEMLVGRAELAAPPYAEFLAGLGCCALCIDAWCFGERAGRSELDRFKEMLWRGQVLWGAMVYDALRAVDYLATRPEVDAGRIATVGMSMGSSLSQWTAALHPGVAACAEICCLTEYEALIEAGGLGEHGVYYFVPGLLKHFTAAEINALIAPRPHLSLAGNLDPLTPVAGLDRMDAELRRVYAALGRPEAWRLARYDGGHQETAAMRAAVGKFLLETLTARNRTHQGSVLQGG